MRRVCQETIVGVYETKGGLTQGWWGRDEDNSTDFIDM